MDNSDWFQWMVYYREAHLTFTFMVSTIDFMQNYQKLNLMHTKGLQIDTHQIAHVVYFLLKIIHLFCNLTLAVIQASVTFTLVWVLESDHEVSMTHYKQLYNYR